MRREFIQTVIGAYQDGDAGARTVFVSTHLISEFEGLIDEFTIIDSGREVLTLDADTARERYQKIYARFAGRAGQLDWPARDVLRRSRAARSNARQRQRGDVMDAARARVAGGARDRGAVARGNLRLRRIGRGQRRDRERALAGCSC